MRQTSFNFAVALVALGLLVSATALLAATSNTPALTKTNAPAAKGTATNAPPVEIPIPISHFAMPSEKGSGKDPFYPDSTRFQPAVPTQSKAGKPVVVVAEVKINGFSGTPEKPFVILNNVTFGTGDEQKVPVGNSRLNVRCLEIRVADQIAIIEVNGERRELRFLNRK